MRLDRSTDVDARRRSRVTVAPRRAAAARADRAARARRRDPRPLRAVDRGRDRGRGARRPARPREAGARLDVDAARHPTTSCSSCAAIAAATPGRRAARAPARRSRGPGTPSSASPGSAPRHGLHVDQAGRSVGSAPTAATPAPTARPTCSTRAASRRATTRRCRGRCPRAAGRRGSRRVGHGARSRSATRSRSPRAPPPGRCGCTCSARRTPAARLRAFLRAAGSLPALLPEWAYGHWKSRDVYEHQRDVEADFEGYAEHDIPLDAIVIDSPWETQYNTLGVQPPPVPGRARADRAHARATACGRSCGSRRG